MRLVLPIITASCLALCAGCSLGSSSKHRDTSAWAPGVQRAIDASTPPLVPFTPATLSKARCTIATHASNPIANCTVTVTEALTGAKKHTYDGLTVHIQLDDDGHIIKALCPNDGTGGPYCNHH